MTTHAADILDSLYYWALFIIQIWVTSRIIWGMYYATRVKYTAQEGFIQREILWFVKWYGDKYLSEWLRKPLYDCPICMGSFWSLVTCVFFGIDFTILMIIPAVAGINYINYRMFPYTED